MNENENILAQESSALKHLSIHLLPPRFLILTFSLPSLSPSLLSSLSLPPPLSLSLSLPVSSSRPLSPPLPLLSLPPSPSLSLALPPPLSFPSLLFPLFYFRRAL